MQVLEKFEMRFFVFMKEMKKSYANFWQHTACERISRKLTAPHFKNWYFEKKKTIRQQKKKRKL